MSFFGKPAEGTPGQPAGGITFGGIGAANQSTGFSFGAAADANKPGGFSFGAASPPSTSAPIFGSSLSTAPTFGSTQPTQSSLFGTTPSSVAAPTQPSTGFSFGQQAIGASFGGFGSPAAPANTAPATQPTTSPFGAKSPSWPSFGTTLPTSTINFGQPVGTTPTVPPYTAAAPATGFPAVSKLIPAATSAVSTSVFGAPAATSTGFAAPTPATTGFGAPAPATGLGSGFGFGGSMTLQKPAASAAPATVAFGANTSIGAGLGTTATTLPTFSGFNFSQNPASTAGGISFGATQAKPALSFGSTTISAVPSTAAVGTSLPAATTAFPATFGSNPLGQTLSTPASTALPSTWGVSTVPTVAQTTGPTSSLSFGVPASAANSATFAKPAVSTTNPTFGVASAQQPAPAQTGLSFGTAFGSTPASTAAALTPSAASMAPSASTMSPSIVAALSTPTKPLATSFGTPETKSALPNFSLSTTLQSATTAASLPASTPLMMGATLTDKVTTTSTGIALGSLPVPSASTAPALSAASTAAASATTQAAPFQLTIPSSTTAVSTTGAQPSTSVAAVAPTQPVPATSMNFGQLEDAINKWSLELEEQEKVFINQATQVNAWDKVLIANGEKIVALNESLQTVRTEQQSLDHELDFVLGQQRELEQLLIPLEKDLGNVVIADPEREQTYRLADSIDTQLKQMSEDLKEIIEHLNESNRREDNNDPIVQIGRILNAHMSSLQWIDTSSAQISQKLDTLSNMHNTLKRRNRMSFNLTYK